MENLRKTNEPQSRHESRHESGQESGLEQLERFQRLVDTYGARLDRWPDDQRGWAWQFQQDNSEAATLLGEAKNLDDLLDKDLAPHPSSALTGNILAAALHPKRQSWREWIGPFWRPASALACAAVIGLAVGMVSPVSINGEESQLTAEVDEIGGDLLTLANLSDGDRAP